MAVKEGGREGGSSRRKQPAAKSSELKRNANVCVCKCGGCAACKVTKSRAVSAFPRASVRFQEENHMRARAREEVAKSARRAMIRRTESKRAITRTRVISVILVACFSRFSSAIVPRSRFFFSPPSPSSLPVLCFVRHAIAGTQRTTCAHAHAHTCSPL